jgi:hypothetical protein
MTLAHVLHSPFGDIREERAMPNTKTEEDKKRGGKREPVLDRAGRRSSPGSGEDENDAADLQPDDVESADTAR